MSGSILKSLKNLFQLSDEQAMWRVQMSDDSEAFAQLLSRWESPIQNLCMRMIGDSHRAQDLTQETFARVYSHRKEYQQQSRFSTYLWRIAVNLCHDELRKARRRHEFSFPALPGQESPEEKLVCDDPSPSEISVSNENAARVRSALLQLPELYRTVVVLRHYEDLKFREIAEVLGIPEGTVKSRMVEALHQLRPLLNGDRLPARQTHPEPLLL